jgi:FkbM family methyltransferase
MLSHVFSALVGTRTARALWRLPGSHRLYRSLMRGLAPSSLVVDGHLLHLDTIDSLLLSVNGSYERFELGLFERCIRDRDVVIDVGAHIGLYSLVAARSVGSAGRVVAFEPSRENFALLSRNVRANGYDHVRLVRAALAGQNGRASLQLSPDNTGDNSLVAPAPRSSARTVETVETMTLDSYLSSEGSGVDVIKMDVQGGEPQVLDGATATLASSPDVILFTEVSVPHLSVEGALSYIGRLRDEGFELFEVDERAATVRRLQDAGLGDATRRAGNDGHVNLVCTKSGAAEARLMSALDGGRRAG